MDFPQKLGHPPEQYCLSFIEMQGLHCEYDGVDYPYNDDRVHNRYNVSDREIASTNLHEINVHVLRIHHVGLF